MSGSSLTQPAAMSGDTRKLSIAVLCHPSLGGSGIVATELAVGLAKRGHRLHVVTTGPLGRALPPCENLTLHVVDTPHYPLFEHPPQLLAVASALARICEQHQLDVIHVHYAVPHAASAYLARQLLGERAPALVTALHGTDVTSVGLEPAYHALTRMCIEASDAITTPSEFLRTQAEALLGVRPEHPIDVIPNCVDTDRFAPAATRDPQHFSAAFGGGELPTLLHVSNFRAVKRPRDLIAVLARVREHMPVRLVLIGDGPERAATQAHTEALGLSQAVRFLGTRASLPDYLRHAAGFLLTSESESFGLAALEALSAGVPVFGYRVGGLPSVVTEDVGRLVAPFDTNALAHAVVSVLEDAALRDDLARAARARALAQFRMQPSLERHERLFERVCARRKSPRP